MQRGLHILPQAGQVIELVTAAGIREGKGVKIIARKKFPQGRGIHRTVELIKAVICQGIAIPYQGGFLCKFGIFFRLEHRRGDGVQVKQKVLFQPNAV